MRAKFVAMKRNRNKRFFWRKQVSLLEVTKKKYTRQMKRLSELARAKHLSEEKEIFMSVICCFYFTWDGHLRMYSSY